MLRIFMFQEFQCNIDSGTAFKRLNHRLGRLLIVLFALIVFAQGISFSFLDYDDTVNIVKNRLVTNPSIQSLESIWEKPHLHLYIPVAYTFWMGIAAFSHLLYGKNVLNPALFHAANILLHILNALIVYEILRMILAIRFDERRRCVLLSAPLLGALFFTIHPVQVESVVWAMSFRDLLSAFFFLSAVGLCLKPYVAKENENTVPITSYVPASFFFLMALLSKPSAVVLPVFVFVLIRFVLGRKPSRAWNIVFFVWLVMAALIVLLTKSAQPVTSLVPIWQRGLVACYTAVFYYLKLAWPWILCIDYGRTVPIILGHPVIWLYPVLIFILPGILWFLPGKKDIMISFFLVLICTSPVLGLVPFTFQRISTVADRYLYVAVFAASIGLSFFIVRYFKQITILALILLICLFGIRSFSYVLKWRDTETLMRYTLDCNSKSFIAAHNLGVALMKKGQMNQAITFLEYALSLDPGNSRARYDLAISYACIGKSDLAEEQRDKVMCEAPELGRILSRVFDLVGRYIRSGDLPVTIKPPDNHLGE